MCSKQQWSCVVVVSVVASRTLQIRIWENPWSEGNLISSLRDGKSSTSLARKKPPWWDQMRVLIGQKLLIRTFITSIFIASTLHCMFKAFLSRIKIREHKGTHHNQWHIIPDCRTFWATGIQVYGPSIQTKKQFLAPTTYSNELCLVVRPKTIKVNELKNTLVP